MPYELEYELRELEDEIRAMAQQWESPQPPGKLRPRVPRRVPASGRCGPDRCTSTYIRWIQTSLNGIGFQLRVTGKLDDPTLKGIASFKARKGLKTKNVGSYVSFPIEQALVAAGAQPPPPLSQRPCGATSPGELIPLLNKYRGDIPLEVLLGWIQKESGRELGSTTSLCERGYFQVHPSESGDLKLNHDPIGTDKDYSVQAGIALVNRLRRNVNALGVTPGTEFYWRLVKLCHWLPSGPKRLFSLMRANGFEPRDWAAIQGFVDHGGEQLGSHFGGHHPRQGTKNVNDMFTLVRDWRTRLGLPSS